MLLFLSSFTESERLDAYFNPGNVMTSKEFINEHKDEILLHLCKVGTSYPTEIARKTGFSIETINKVLSELSNGGLVVNVKPDKWHVKPIFHPRVYSYEFPSFDLFNRRSWWVLTLDAVGYIKVKYKGEGKQISKYLLIHYGLDIPGQEKSELSLSFDLPTHLNVRKFS